VPFRNGNICWTSEESKICRWRRQDSLMEEVSLHLGLIEEVPHSFIGLFLRKYFWTPVIDYTVPQVLTAQQWARQQVDSSQSWYWSKEKFSSKVLLDGQSDSHLQSKLLEGSDQENWGPRSAQANNSWDLISNITRGKWTGSVAQEVEYLFCNVKPWVQTLVPQKDKRVLLKRFIGNRQEIGWTYSGRYQLLTQGSQGSMFTWFSEHLLSGKLTHTCNTSYSRGRDWKDWGSRSAWAKKWKRPHLNP
jgi:hypothetical protein